MEAILGVQIVAILFAFFMLYVTFLHSKRGNITPPEYLFWVLLWAGFIFLTLKPDVLNPLLKELFIVRALDLLTLAAFMILAYLGFQNHIGVKVLQKKIEWLIRNQAIKDAQKKKR